MSLGSLAKLPPRRYTAEVDLGRLWLWPWAEPLLLTSGPLASVEMTHVVGRHFFREYGVFTRFFIFSPAPSRAPSGCTPGRQEGTLIRITFHKNYSSGINRIQPYLKETDYILMYEWLQYLIVLTHIKIIFVKKMRLNTDNVHKKNQQWSRLFNLSRPRTITFFCQSAVVDHKWLKTQQWATVLHLWKHTTDGLGRTKMCHSWHSGMTKPNMCGGEEITLIKACLYGVQGHSVLPWMEIMI